jgi:hypothetical protein
LYPQRSSSRAPNWVGTDGCNTAAVLDALGPSAIDRLNGLLKRQNVPYRLRLERVGEPVLARLLRLTGTPATSNVSANPPNLHHIIRQFDSIRDSI